MATERLAFPVPPVLLPRPACLPTAPSSKSFASTELVKVGTNYFLDAISSGTGPELKYTGAPVTVGEFGDWAPIGTEQVTGGI